jgi:hypothetical protein
MFDLILIGTIIGLTVHQYKSIQKKEETPSDYPTIPSPNVHSSELMKEWEARLQAVESKRYIKPDEESPYRSLLRQLKKED